MWTSIIGHKQQIAHLQTALAGDRLAAAYLFAGVSGIGKYRVAVTLAQAMHCPTSQHNTVTKHEARSTKHEPCGACAACTRIAAGTHPDVQLIAPEKHEIKVDQVRTMQERLQFHPLEGAAKCVIIDHAEAMHAAAANACLKILEEPPSATHFFLISAQPHRLLPTIRSRCQTIAFQPLPTAQITRQLVTERGLAETQAAAIAAIAEGSLGFALACLPELVEETRGDIATLGAAAKATDVLTMAERWAADAAALPIRLRLLATAVGATAARELRDTGHTALAERLQQLLHLTQAAESTTFNKQLLCEALLFNYGRR